MTLIIRGFELVVMDTNTYTDEYVYNTLKAMEINMEDYEEEDLEKIRDTINSFRPRLWPKINSEFPIFYQIRLKKLNM